MSFPVTRDGHELTYITAMTDGMTVMSVPAPFLAAELGPWLAPEVVAWLEGQGERQLTLKELAQQGIRLEFDPQTLDFKLALQMDANRMRTISLDRPEQVAEYSDAAAWLYQQHFNLSHQYQRRTDRNDTLLEWLGAVNVGGHRGLNLEWSGYLDKRDGESARFDRGPTRAFVDRPSWPMRFSAGDVTPYLGGHLPGIALGGVLVERNYGQLQPSRNISNGGTQEVELTETADVDIYVNDLRVTRLRLSPGRYRLDELPLASGSNEIRLEIQYQSGRRETLNYSQFFNSRLLRQGVDDFTLTAGWLSEFTDERGIDYEDAPLMAANYEYGLTEGLTLGANGLAAESGQILGLTAVTGGRWGNLGTRFSYGHYKDLDSEGGIASLDYSQRIWGSSAFGSPNFRVSYEWLDNFTSQPWEPDSQRRGERVFADYTALIGSDWDLNLSGSYGDFVDELTEKVGRARVSWNRWGLRLSFGVEHREDATYEDGDTRGFVALDWSGYYPQYSHRARVNYDSLNELGRVEIARESQSRVGEWEYELAAEQGNNLDRQSLRAGYVANRWRGEMNLARAGESGAPSNELASVRFSSTQAWSDGHFGWGQGGIGPKAVVHLHPSLEEADAVINGLAGEAPDAYATGWVGAAVTLSAPHRVNSLWLDVPEAPLGYDWGQGGYLLTPGTLTGHTIQVGSDASKTVIGTLLTPAGEPVSLRQGIASNGEREIRFFTNRGGRFVLEGVAPGDYLIQFATEPKLQGMLEVVDDGDMLIRLAPLRLEQGE
ncbi:fimbria/pilus outer membrane usher protein [Ferrimonas marina]|nr:fimbria/pilus outer membrane usher protein [Ferrimonas marina]